MHSRFRKTEYGIEILEDNRQKFIDSLKIGDTFVVDYIKGTAAKTYLQVKYLFGGVYKAFVPNVYESVRIAHKELAELFLQRTDIIEIEDTDKLIEVFSKCRTNNPILEDVKIFSWRDGMPRVKRKIKWVRSVASLSKRELNEYISNIIRKGAEMDIIIMDSDTYLEQLKG